MCVVATCIGTSDLAEAIDRLNVDKMPLSATIRAAYMRQETGDWRFVTARCVVTPEKEERQAVYRNNAFLSKSLSELSIEAFIAKVESAGYEVSSQFPPIKMSAHNPNWTEEIVPSDGTGTGFPVRRFSATIDPNAFFIESQLIAFGMPFHISAAEYLNEFLGFERIRGSRDVRKGELSIDIDDRRGAIVSTPASTGW